MSEKFKLLKYNQAKLAVMRLIGEQGLKCGDRLPTERELVQLLPFSMITLRHALSVLEKEGVISRDRRKGTFLRKHLKDVRFDAEVLVVSVAKRGEPIPYSPPLEPLRLYLEGRGIGLRTKTVYEFGLDILEAAERTIGIFVSGWLTDSFLEHLEIAGVPIIVLGNNELTKEVPVVGEDKESAAFCQTVHLINEGRKKIMLLGVSRSYYSSILYEKGYRKAMKQAGLSPLIFETESLLDSTGEMEEFLGKHRDVEAILMEAQLLCNFTSWFWRQNKPLLLPAIAFLTAPAGLHQYRQGRQFRLITTGDIYQVAANKLLDHLLEGEKIESEMLPPVIPDDSSEELFYLF